ncbi:phenol hydroxylase [Seongchinamella unica]|uniref:Phenol hydroxylase n=1 Tax=Seongchinamella unica TaxID=2547392 RepID=A0A4R5LT06_9GAMM|nr:phenol hydroxylase subunit P4 [Seongchinamella unica]TDG14063.1 phenol hydroxylase [Seongchinamella unica]
MPVAAIVDNYRGERLDALANFHGNQILYLGWDHHLMFCSPVALPVPPDMPFGKVIGELMPGAFSLHPEFGQIDWSGVVWHLNGEPFTPDMDKGLAEQGIDHKSIVRFATPGLDGIGGSGS